MVSPVTLVRLSFERHSLTTKLFAQKYLPPQAWGIFVPALHTSNRMLVPFFNLVSFVLGTYINAQTKRSRRLAALKKQVISCNETSMANRKQAEEEKKV